jgi:hypothetical protein
MSAKSADAGSDKAKKTAIMAASVNVRKVDLYGV